MAQTPRRIEAGGDHLNHLDGTINVNHRLDQSLRVALNTPGVYEGDIVNRQNIGKSMDDLTTLWNESQPLDPIS